MINVKTERGFTLIELLIVIVIIGILAGVLIAVINPASQQNRARNATVTASLNKIALATSGFLSSTGRIPEELEFLEGINATASGTTCNQQSLAECQFSITSFSLPIGVSSNNAGCGASGWNGPGNAQCYFRYCGGDDAIASTACTWSATTTSYRLVARAFGSPGVYMYRSSDSAMYLCNAAGSTCTVL